MKSLGIVIREMRKEKGLSQGELAAKAGVCQSELSQAEKERRRVSNRLLEVVANAMQEHPLYLRLLAMPEKDAKEVALKFMAYEEVALKFMAYEEALPVSEKDIQFKEEFEAKLSELGVREEFVEELLRPEGFNRQLLHYLCSCSDFKDLISSAFSWYHSKKGYAYWSNIAKQ